MPLSRAAMADLLSRLAGGEREWRAWARTRTAASDHSISARRRPFPVASASQRRDFGCGAGDLVVDDEEESLGCTTSSADGEDLIALVYRDEALVMGNEFETITFLDDDDEEYDEDIITGWTYSIYVLDTDGDGESFWDYFSTDGSDNVDDAKDIINKWWERVKGGE